MSNWLREAVSKKKRRYRQDGFDLDLTYITDRIIAMGFPASGNEKYFRNPIDEIVKFYEHYHKDNYKLYNLCAEREYDYNKFHNRVSRYPFYDHNAPSVQLIKDCCNDVVRLTYDTYLKENEKHIVGINCKAGKGRTGLIICCYLLYSGKCDTTDAALKYYGERRTKDGKGVTIASQQRYIRYYERVLKEFKGEIPRPHKFTLKKLVIKGVPKISGKQFITIEIDNKETFRSTPTDVEEKDDTYELPVGAPVKGDVKIQLLANKKTFLCHFWFNTGFIDNKELKIAFEKPTIDVANKDRKCKVFKENFSITAIFETYEGPETESDKEDKKKDKEAKETKLKDGNEKPKDGDKGKGKEGGKKEGNGSNGSKEMGGKKKEGDKTPTSSDEEKGDHKDPSFYNYEDYDELKKQGVEISSTSSSQYASSSGEGSSSSDQKTKKKSNDSAKTSIKEGSKGADSPKVSTKDGTKTPSKSDSPKTGKRDSSVKDPMAKQNSKADVKKMTKQDSKADVKKKEDKDKAKDEKPKEDKDKPKEEKAKEDKPKEDKEPKAKEEKLKEETKEEKAKDSKKSDKLVEEKPKEEKEKAKEDKPKEDKAKEEKKDKGTPKAERKEKDDKPKEEEKKDKEEKEEKKDKEEKEEKKDRSKEPIKKEKSKADGSKSDVKK